MPRWPEHLNFRKIVTVLAITFGIALGLCGLNFVAVASLRGHMGRPGMVLMVTAYVELAAMILSAMGLLICLLARGITSIIARSRHGRSMPQRLFDDKNTDDKSER